MFKSGAVRIDKVPNRTNEVQIHQKQTAAVESVEKSKPNAQAVKGQDPNIRHLGYWLGATYEAIDVLLDIFDRLLYRILLDKELHAGLNFQRNINQAILDRMSPFVEKYHEKREYGQTVSKALRDTLFPSQDEKAGAFETLNLLQGLSMYLAHINGHLAALGPASQALWDKEFIGAVTFATEQVQRQNAWATAQIKVRSPQTLLVPSKQDTPYERIFTRESMP